jgi:IS5 family transposase
LRRITPKARPDGHRFHLQTMLRVHFMQQWFTLSDPGMEEAFFDTPLYREFAQLEEFARLPDESTILRFATDWRNTSWLRANPGCRQRPSDSARLAAQDRHRGRRHPDSLRRLSTKNKDKARDPEMHSSQKGNQWHFGMKAHIGADADSDWCTPFAAPQAMCMMC